MMLIIRLTFVTFCLIYTHCSVYIGFIITTETHFKCAPNTKKIYVLDHDGMDIKLSKSGVQKNANTHLSLLLDSTVNKELQPAAAAGHKEQQHIFLLQQPKTDLNLKQIKTNSHCY